MMKKVFKRMLAVFVMTAVVFGTIFSNGIIAALAGNLLFYDDFSTETLNGWKSNAVGKVQAGLYYLSNHETNSITTVGDKSNMQISADVTVNRGTDSTGALQNSIASLVINANEDFSQGYEFGIGVTKKGSTYVRLYLRGEEADSRILSQKSTDIPGAVEGEIIDGVSYRLSVGVYEGVINCFVNNELVITYTDTTYKSGYCGIKTVYSTSVFDNVQVEEIPEKKVESISLQNTPEEISRLGELDFDVYATYADSFHQSEIIASNDDRITVTGFNRTVGTKNVKVTYGGKSASFRLNVVEVRGETVVFEDSFVSDTSDNYDVYETKYEDSSTVYKFASTSGKLTAAMPKLPAGFDSALIAKYTLKTDISKDFGKYYTVSADAVISDVLNTPTTRRATAEISAFTDTNGHVYRFRATSQGLLKFACDSTEIFSIPISSLEGQSFELGKKFTLSMSVSENIIICRYNDKEVFYYTGADMSTYQPKVYVYATNGTVSFDNLKVTSIEKYAADAARSISVYSSTTNTKITSYTGPYINTEKLYLVVAYVGGEKRTVGLTESMLTNYNPDKKVSQNVVVAYGLAKLNFRFLYSEALFVDRFDEEMSPLWTISAANDVDLSVNNGALRTKWNGSTVDAIPYISTDVEGAEEWRNYSVSADISFDTIMSKSITSGSFYSMYVRRTGVDYYDLRLITRGGALTLSLYRYMNKSNEQIMTWSSTDLNIYLNSKYQGTKTASNGVSYNLKVLCKDDTLYIYLDDILIGTHVETLEGAPYAGYAGMKLSKVSGSVDNFIVEEKGPRNITKISVAGVENNSFELYEGFEINPYDYTLECHDADGSVFYESLTADMISPYDNLEVGTQNITITAYGKTQKAVVVIQQRDDYINVLNKDLETLNVSKLAISDKDAIYDLAARYDELSGYEITKLSDKAIDNMVEAREKMETLVYPEIADYDVIYRNDFNDEMSCNPDVWGTGPVTGRGEWVFINGSYRLEQKRHGISTTGWRVNENLYAEVHSVSSRIMLLSEAMYAGVGLNMTGEGYYLARVKMDTFDSDTGEVIPMFQLIKNEERLFALELAGYDVHIEENEWFTIQLTFVAGVISAYVNDTLIVSFDDSESVLYHTEGYAGMQGSSGNCMFDNFVVRGVEVEKPESSVKPTPTTYSDDFEDEAANADPSHWVEVNTNDDWKTVDTDGNTYYGTSRKDSYTYTWLHIFESNPTVSMDFMTKSKSSEGFLGFFIRMAPETAYVRIGYDFSTQKWYVTETQGERDCEIYTTYSEKKYQLSANEWHKLKIIAQGSNLSVTVDGTEVLSLERVSQIGYGRIGVFADGTSVYFDNIHCELPDGDYAQDGVLEYTIIPDIYNGSIELESIDENTLFGLNDGATVYSDNQGQTFEIVGGTKVSEDSLTSDALLIERFEPVTANNAYTSTMQLHDGSIICLKLLEMICLKSTDGAKTWNAAGRVMPEEDIYDELGRRGHTLHVNSITEYQLPDGTWRIFVPVAKNFFKSNLTSSSSGHYTVVYYSDDGGATWKMSENDTRDVMIGYEEADTSSDWAESKIVLCSDGTMRMYYTRGNIGCMSYTVSHDYGVTWEGHYTIPEMQCAKSSFSVIEDPTEKGTYYLVWVNNNAVSTGSHFSRTRISLAKSTDGMNWEFLCDLERMTEEVYGNNMRNRTPLFQIIDPSIEVTDKYIYVTFGRSDGTDPTKVVDITTSYHNSQRTRFVRIEKDKVSVRAWDASTISNMLFTKSLEITEPIRTRYGVGDIFSYGGGTAVLTALDGSTRTINTSRLYMYDDEPDTYELGKHTVTLYDANNNKATYEIEVVPKYRVKWTINGNGTVDSKVNSVLEGDDLSVKLQADSIFCRVKVTVNDKKVSTTFRTLKLKDIKEDLDITVTFIPFGVFEYLLIVINVAALGGIVTFGVVCIKKKRNPLKVMKDSLSKMRKPCS